jgi:hypothetical protein
MIALALAAQLLAVPDGTLIEVVVAVVDKEVITRSELLTEARVALAMQRGGDGSEAASIDEQFLADFRDYLINQILIAGQARRLGAAEVSEDEVTRDLERFANQFRSASAYQAFLRRHDIQVPTLRGILRRHLRNERYIEQRMRARRLGASGTPIDEKEYQEGLRQWLGELRDTAEIRLPGPDGELEIQDAAARPPRDPR